MKRASWVALAFFGVLLSACGGGGGDGVGVAPAATNGSATGGEPSSTTTPGAPATPVAPASPTTPAAPADTGTPPPGTPSGGSTSPGAPAGGTGNGTTPPATPPATPSDPGTQPPPTGGTVDPSRALAARFNRPLAIATDATGTLYVADTGTVRKITPAGEVTTIAGTPGQFGDASTGGSDGTGTEARFNVLTGITVGSDGNLYVTDTVTNTGKIRRITPAGVVTTVLPNVYGLGITADGAGNVYFTNNFNSYIGVIRPGSGASTLVQLSEPRGITVDDAGNLYVTNTGLDYGPLGQNTFSCTIDRIAPSGQVTTLAGAKAAGERDNTCSSVDGGRAAARIGSGAHGIAVDGAGNVYFADTNNHTIRRIAADGTVTTLAGTTGAAGSADGTGATARFNRPRGITLGRDGSLYVADTENHTIRKVTPAGVVTTFAGKAGESGSTDVSIVPAASPTPAPAPAIPPPVAAPALPTSDMTRGG